MKVEMYVYLSITGPNLDPLKVTDILGITPTETYLRGDRIGNSNLFCKASSWQYKMTADSDTPELEVMVKRILGRFPDKRKLKRAISLGKAKMVCVFYDSSQRMTQLELTTKTIKRLAELNCGLWIDYY